MTTAGYGYSPQILRPGPGMRFSGAGVVEASADDPETIAALSALPGTTYPRSSYVEETDAHYDWIPGDTTAVDGWRVFAATGGTSGRWILNGDTISIAPRGGGLDDWARLFGVGGAAAAMAYRGRIRLRPGTWICSTVQDMPNGTTIEGSSGVTILMSLAAVGLPTVAAFSADIGALGNLDTLSTAANRGTFSIVTTTAAPFAVGDIVQISNAATAGNTAGFRVSTHTIVGVAGVNANLDRPLPRDYGALSNVRRMTSIPQDIYIDGGGMLITGTGVRAIEIKGARRCVVKNIFIDDSSGAIPSDYLVSLDGGGHDNRAENIQIRVLGASTPVGGITVESNDGTTVTQCVVDGGCSFGIVLFDCSDCYIDQCQVLRCPAASGAGLALVADTAVHSATTEGCISCVISDCVALNCVRGISIRDGSLGNKIVSCSAEGNTSVGIEIGVIGGDTTIVDGNQIIACSARRNTTYGLATGTLSRRTKVVGIDLSNNGTSAATGTGVLAQGDLDLTDAISRGGNGAGFLSATGGSLDVSRLRLVHTQAASNVILFPGGTSRASIRDSDITVAASSNAINTNDAIRIEGTRITAAANGLVQGNGAQSTIGPGCDFSGATAAVFINSGTVVVEQVGSASRSLAGANATLTFTEASRQLIRGTGAFGAAREMIVPNLSGMLWLASNESSDANTMTVKTAAGAGIAIAQGKTAWVRGDGTNVVRVTPDSP